MAAIKSAQYVEENGKLIPVSRTRAWKNSNQKKWRTANRAKIEEYNQRARLANKQPERARRRGEILKAWKKSNRSRVIEHNRRSNKKHAAYISQWKLEWEKRRAKSDPVFRLRRSMAALMRAALSNKSVGTWEIIGCTPAFFKKWIESQFLPGMSFSNRADWQIDHVFPVSCCASEADVRLSFNYRNLRPAWNTDNRFKWDAVIDESIVAAFLCGITSIKLRRPDQISEQAVRVSASLQFKIVEAFHG